MRASAFCWPRSVPAGVGGTRPAPAFPRRGKRERGRPNSLLPQAFSFTRPPFPSRLGRYRLRAAWMRSPQII